jgi:predicted permease
MLRAAAEIVNRQIEFLARLTSDLRYAWRMLRRSGGFTAVAIGSLALGIGANTIVLTLAKSVLFDRLAVPDPGELRLISAEIQSFENNPIRSMWGGWDVSSGGKPITPYISYPVYLQMRDRNRAHPVIGDLFGFKSLGQPLSALVDGRPDEVTGELVSGNFYQQLGVRPALGRAIAPSDDAPDATPVAVISDSLWLRWFGRSQQAIGKVIQLNFRPVTIVGVNEPRFTGAATVQKSPEIFIPFSLQPSIVPWAYGSTESRSLLNDNDTWWMSAMGRVLPGVSSGAANAALNLSLAQAAHSTLKLEGREQAPRLVLEPGGRGISYINRMYDEPVSVLVLLSGVVLALTCVNLLNFLRTRFMARRMEFSIRLALGSSRGRVFRQVVFESLLLATAGGAIGLMLGYCGRDALPGMLSSLWKVAPLTTRFDWRIFGLIAAVSIGTGLALGIAPGFMAIRSDIDAELKQSSGFLAGRRQGTTGKAALAFQIALSTLLVADAGLFGRTLANLTRAGLGFNPDHLLLFEIDAPDARYPAPANVALHERMETRFAEMPGVWSVSVSTEPVLGNVMSSVQFQPIGKETENGARSISWINTVGEGFFRTYQIPILYGRGFEASDRSRLPLVAVINQTNAKMFFHGASPIGRMV